MGCGAILMQRHLVVDTHALLWFLEDNAALSDAAASALGDAEATLYLPSICILEAFNVIRKKKTPVTADELTEVFRSEARLAVLPLDERTAMIATTLVELTGIHDRAIVASAMQLTSEVGADEVWLVTADREIHDCNRVRTIW
jgi:PIN domain nuclease of toxin-antitoxin system